MDIAMKNRHGMFVVGHADTSAAASPGELQRHLSHAGALMGWHLRAVAAAAGIDPARWTGARTEDVIATLDRIATIAACEADRVRDFRDHRS